MITCKTKKDNLIMQIQAIKSKRSTLSNNINEFESELKKLQQQAEIQLNEERTVEIKLSKLEVEMNALQDHLEDTYELTLDEAETRFSV